jgi:hypothetical protein
MGRTRGFERSFPKLSVAAGNQQLLPARILPARRRGHARYDPLLPTCIASQGDSLECRRPGGCSAIEGRGKSRMRWDQNSCPANTAGSAGKAIIRRRNLPNLFTSAKAGAIVLSGYPGYLFWVKFPLARVGCDSRQIVIEHRCHLVPPEPRLPDPHVDALISEVDQNPLNIHSRLSSRCPLQT